MCNEHIFRNGSFREFKIAKESNDFAYFCNIQSDLGLRQPLIGDHLSSPFMVYIKNVLERANSFKTAQRCRLQITILLFHVAA